jgi:hypothetical protein
MTNPSTVWAQLALPNPAVGSLPFVDTDGASIITDVLNLFYTKAGASLSGSLQNSQLTVAGGLRETYSDTTGVPGAATINKPAGRVKMAAGQTSLVVTNSYCFATSIVNAQIEGAAFDATATRLQVTPGAGTFTITFNAAATAAVVISFDILNVF